MKIVKKSEAKKFDNSKACTAFEYPLNDKDINGAIVEISGRYPEKGLAMNEKCKELAYVIEGSGKFVMAGKEILFSEGDLLFIEPGEKYFWEAKAKLFMPCSPAWYPEQHKIIA